MREPRLKRATRKPAQIIKRRIADEDNAVVTTKGGRPGHRHVPCRGCPWVKENAGNFPAEAFRISASTAYDGSIEQFGCHESGSRKPATCAGFLLQNSLNNLGTRITLSNNGPADVRVDGRELWPSYRDMAIGNGVDPDDPVLVLCRADWE